MAGPVYKMAEVVGTSNKNFAEACSGAVKKASETLRGLGWFEVVELRGRVEDGKIAEYQAKIKIGFKLD